MKFILFLLFLVPKKNYIHPVYSECPTCGTNVFRIGAMPKE